MSIAVSTAVRIERENFEKLDTKLLLINYIFNHHWVQF